MKIIIMDWLALELKLIDKFSAVVRRHQIAIALKSTLPCLDKLLNQGRVIKEWQINSCGIIILQNFITSGWDYPPEGIILAPEKTRLNYKEIWDTWVELKRKAESGGWLPLKVRRLYESYNLLWRGLKPH